MEAQITRLTDLEALKVVIKSNFLQRENILPSERGKAYMLRNEALKKERYGFESHCGTQEEKDIQAKKKKNKSVKAVIKKYSGYFKNEQEFADRIDKLLAEYFEQKAAEKNT